MTDSGAKTTKRWWGQAPRARKCGDLTSRRAGTPTPPPALVSWCRLKLKPHRLPMHFAGAESYREATCCITMPCRIWLDRRQLHGHRRHVLLVLDVRVSTPAVTGGRSPLQSSEGCCGTKGVPAVGVLKSTLPIIAPPKPTASSAAGLSKSRMALLACPAGGPFCPRSPRHRWLFMSEGLARVARKGPGPAG